MTLEFERCQAEERERIEFFKETLLQFHKLTDISQAVQDAHATCLARLQQVSPPRDLELFARDFGVDMPMIIPDADGNWYLEGSTPPSQGGAAYSSSSGVASKADGTTGSGAANTSVVSTDSAAGAQLSNGSGLAQGVTLSSPQGRVFLTDAVFGGKGGGEGGGREEKGERHEEKCSSSHRNLSLLPLSIFACLSIFTCLPACLSVSVSVSVSLFSPGFSVQKSKPCRAGRG